MGKPSSTRRAGDRRHTRQATLNGAPILIGEHAPRRQAAAIGSEHSGSGALYDERRLRVSNDHPSIQRERSDVARSERSAPDDGPASPGIERVSEARVTRECEYRTAIDPDRTPAHIAGRQRPPDARRCPDTTRSPEPRSVMEPPASEMMRRPAPGFTANPIPAGTHRDAASARRNDGRHPAPTIVGYQTFPYAASWPQVPY